MRSIIVSVGTLESYASTEGSIVFNAEHYPVLFVTWFGVPTSSVVEAYSKWLHELSARAHHENRRFVIIGDTTRLSERPSPTIRRHMAEAVNRFNDAAGDKLLGVVTIIDSVMMRAAIKMTIYLTRRTIPITPVSSLDEAMARAFALLDEAGVPHPEGLDLSTYRPPLHPLGSSDD